MNTNLEKIFEHMWQSLASSIHKKEKRKKFHREIKKLEETHVDGQ